MLQANNLLTHQRIRPHAVMIYNINVGEPGKSGPLAKVWNRLCEVAAEILPQPQSCGSTSTMYKINFFAEPSARGSGRQEEDLPGYTPSFGATPPGGPPEAPGYARRKKAGVATSKYTRWGPRRNTVVVVST